MFKETFFLPKEFHVISFVDCHALCGHIISPVLLSVSVISFALYSLAFFFVLNRLNYQDDDEPPHLHNLD